MPLVFLQQADLFAPAQTGYPHLLERAPSRKAGPALPHRVTPAIHLLALLLMLGHAPIPLRCQQAFNALPQRIQKPTLHLPPALLDHILQG